METVPDVPNEGQNGPLVSFVTIVIIIDFTVG